MEANRLAGCSFDLDGRNIHVWSIRIEASTAVATKFEQVLSPDERDRAARFYFDDLWRSFVLARGALRALLGCYLKIPPANVQFTYGSKGKPALGAIASVDFSMSHSGRLAVFAFTRGCEIGIDLEQIRPIQDMQRIADLFFCPDEAADLMLLTPRERERAFFLCWTRKEAYIKAIGDGLSVPLDGFRVTVRPTQSARFIHFAGNTDAAKDWALHDLQLVSNYVAALAYRGAEHPITMSPVVNAADLLSIL